MTFTDTLWLAATNQGKPCGELEVDVRFIPKHADVELVSVCACGTELLDALPDCVLDQIRRNARNLVETGWFA